MTKDLFLISWELRFLTGQGGAIRFFLFACLKINFLNRFFIMDIGSVNRKISSSGTHMSASPFKSLH